MLLTSVDVGRLVYDDENLSPRRAMEICAMVMVEGGLRPIKGRERGKRFRKSDIEAAVNRISVATEI